MASATVADRARAWLACALDEGRLCPVLGAGASAQAGTPQWPELVWQLARKEGLLSGRCAPKSWREADLALLVDLVASSGLADRLRRALYKAPRDWVHTGFPAKGNRAATPFHDTTLVGLAWLAIVTARRNPHRPFHVVTYNFDCLLEEALSALGHHAIAVAPPDVTEEWYPARTPRPRKTRSLTLFEQYGYEISPQRVRILHAHGIAPRERRARRPSTRKDSGDHLVFSATSYERKQLSVTNLFDVAQTGAFGQLVDFFYGFSFADFEVRSLLRASQLQAATHQEPHVALLQIDEIPRVPKSTPELVARWTRYLRHLGVMPVRSRGFSAQTRFVRSVLTEMLVKQNKLALGVK